MTPDHITLKHVLFEMCYRAFEPIRKQGQLERAAQEQVRKDMRDNLKAFSTEYFTEYFSKNDHLKLAKALLDDNDKIFWHRINRAEPTDKRAFIVPSLNSVL
jgi:hypothetical protein